MFHIHCHNNIKYFERVVLKKLTRFLFPKIFLIQHVLHLHSRRKNNASNVKTVIKDPRKILSQNEDIKFPSNFFSKKRVTRSFRIVFNFEGTRYRGKTQQKGIGQPLCDQFDEYSSLLNTDPF